MHARAQDFPELMPQVLSLLAEESAPTGHNDTAAANANWIQQLYSKMVQQEAC